MMDEGIYLLYNKRGSCATHLTWLCDQRELVTRAKCLHTYDGDDFQHT